MKKYIINGISLSPKTMDELLAEEYVEEVEDGLEEKISNFFLGRGYKLLAKDESPYIVKNIEKEIAEIAKAHFQEHPEELGLTIEEMKGDK